MHFGTLYHLANPVTSIDKCVRSLKRGGWFALETMCYRAKDSTACKWIYGFDGDKTNFWSLGKEALRSMVLRTGITQFEMIFEAWPPAYKRKHSRTMWLGKKGFQPPSAVPSNSKVASSTSLQRHSSLPRNKVVLPLDFSFRAYLAAGDANSKLKDLLSEFLHSGIAGHDLARIYINDVGHAPSKLGIGGNLNHGRNGIPCGSSKAGREQYHVGSRSDLRGNTLDVIAGRALQV